MENLADKSQMEQNTKKILLLTNRDSDNLGDQVIEATDIALVSAVMKNLGIEDYQIHSKAASIVSKKYLKEREDKYLNGARAAIKENDIIVFGGAPIFNYAYQVFYERTAVTIELANEQNKPVIFSAIGIEGYDEDNEKCQYLKKAVNYDCVKMITTRDGIEHLKQYKEREDLIIDKVSDPAVFTSCVFDKYKAPKEKKIGIFVLRANGFVDNGVPFPAAEAARLWKQIGKELGSRGYEYEYVTSGHFGDEAFLDNLVRNYSFPPGKCVFNMNTPENLIEKISSYQAVISCRLHPNIIAFSLGVPAIGIRWNGKVKKFYESIEYPDRCMEATDITAEKVADKLEAAMKEGVKQDQEYMMSIYNRLFDGFRKAFGLEDADVKPYTYEELIANLPEHKETSEKEELEKIRRKFRRTYGKYNEQAKKLADVKKENEELKRKLDKKLSSRIKRLLRSIKRHIKGKKN